MHPPRFPAQSVPFHSHLLHSPPKPNLQMEHRQNKNILPFCCAFPSQGSQNHGYPAAAACICILSTVGAGLYQRQLGRDQGCSSLLILQLTQPSGEGLGSSCSIPQWFWGSHSSDSHWDMKRRHLQCFQGEKKSDASQPLFFPAGRKAKLVPLQSVAGQHSPALAWPWQHVLPV